MNRIDRIAMSLLLVMVIPSADAADYSRETRPADVLQAVTALSNKVRWDRSTLWAALGLLGFTQGAHAAGNIASKRAAPRAEPVWMTDGDAERIAARVREVYEGDIEGNSTAIKLASAPRWRAGLGWCVDLRGVA